MTDSKYFIATSFYNQNITQSRHKMFQTGKCSDLIFSKKLKLLTTKNMKTDELWFWVMHSYPTATNENKTQSATKPHQIRYMGKQFTILIFINYIVFICAFLGFGMNEKCAF